MEAMRLLRKRFLESFEEDALRAALAGAGGYGANSDDGSSRVATLVEPEPKI